MTDHIQTIREALETPDKMVDADLMFCINGSWEEFSHIPYKDVKEIALRTCRLIAGRNIAAIAALSELEKQEERG